MPFSQSVRDQALVAAARHCCVCHRYGGVRVEVHHIVHESKSGANVLDNAITLCFDCHADAGHYNPDHPRGTKFSPGELKRHRDRWHEMVRSHAIRPPDSPDVLYCRFLLCKSFEAIREISLGDLANVPVTQPLLAHNSVRQFQRKIVDTHPVSYRHDKEWGDAFPDRETYAKSHPEVSLHERSTITEHPYFEASRLPSIDELRVNLAPRDEVTRLLIEAGVAPQNISQVFAYYEECGDDRFQEIYRLRPLWTLYLAATNITDTQITLSEIACETHNPPGTGYRSFAPSVGHDHQNSTEGLPTVPLLPGATMLFPVATLLGPLQNFTSESIFQERSDLSTGAVQVVSHEDLSTANTGIAMIGSVSWPKTIKLQMRQVNQEQQIHEFDLARLYSITRYWEMGSCPHLFLLQSNSDRLTYLRELFAKFHGVLQREHIVVPAKTRALLIAEIEFEQTIIREILVNGKSFLIDATLSKGDCVWIPVQAGDMVELTGYYVARTGAPTDPWLRNSLIHGFLERTLIG